MPGLSQLKKFNSDILSLGNEPELRSKRGEKAVTFPIPKSIKDKDDSDDFVMGMPEPVNNGPKVQKKDEPEDFSDIMGISSSKTESPENKVPDTPGISLPDVSSILNNTVISEEDSGVPDLSMFMDEEEEEPVVEEKPKEKQIDELSLDDLLGGAGFDGSEGLGDESEDFSSEEENATEEEETNTEEESSYEKNPEPAVNNSQNNINAIDESIFKVKDGFVEPENEIPSLDAALSESKPENDLPPDLLSALNADSEQNSSDSLQSANLAENIPDLPSSGDVNLSSDKNTTTGNDLLDSLNQEPKIDSDGIEELDTMDFAPGESFSLEDFPELSDLTSSDKENTFDTSLDSFSSDNLFSGEKADSETEADSFQTPENAVPSEIDGIQIEDDSPSQSSESENNAGETGLENNKENSENGFEDFNLDGIDFSQMENFESGQENDVLPAESSDFSNEVQADGLESLDSPEDISQKADESAKDSSLNSEDMTVPQGLFDSMDMELPDGLDDSFQEDFKKEAEKNDEFVTSDFGSDDKAGDFNLDVPDFSLDSDSNSDIDSDLVSDSPSDSITESISDPLTDFTPDSEKKSDDFASTFGLENSDFSSSEGIDLSPEELELSSEPLDTFDEKTGDNNQSKDSEEINFSDFDFNMDDTPQDGENTSFEEGPAPENFDLSAMEGMDFPDTDAQLNASGGDFEFSNADSMALDNGDFEIPGYTGDNILDEKQQDKLRKKKEEPVQASEDELPPNTLTDAQYKKFLKNLSGYPLNVRVALEDLIVKNEFTDDAEFEIIQKVLKKIPARQLAGELEKMLDIPISVPRDFERRTAEEYEAYKASFSYQLRNKIIPIGIVSIAAAASCIGLFFFGKNCIYRPARAGSLYRQGYAYLEAENYPQSEIKFKKACDFKIKKNWFYKYARGYRDHKQYIRAEQMYKTILAKFKHEKQAGLEYAGMELEDLANYERAEEILLREVLDNYINDPDGLLLLGDTYLEWACEKDPSKFENARVKYSELYQLYGGKNFASNILYKGRMMRYFVRTDNLLEVLQLKDSFMIKRKTLSSDDWTEMSGYLLDKLYGEIEPSQEYLRTKIEDVKEMIMRSVKADEKNPVALYNLGKYYVYMNNGNLARSALDHAIDAFKTTDKIKRRDMYKFIDSYRLYGEEYAEMREYFKALEQYTAGIALYQKERDGNGFEGNQKVGKLYQDMGDIDYFVSGDMDSALLNYQSAIDTENDIPEIRYRIGYIKYNKQNYTEALGSFMKAGEDYPDDVNLLLAMGNTLSLKNDNFASQGYYEHLLEELNLIIDQKNIVYPQSKVSHAEIVEAYMKANNNLGVTLYRLAKRTGSSLYNAKAMVNFQESLRTWDTLTRNQTTMTRLPGGNLAEQNLKYISHPLPEYEPAIYTDLPKTLLEENSK